MLSEFRLAFRSLVKSPGFTVIALITLALGIGVNTSMFSVLNALMFRTPYPDDTRLVRIYRTSPQSQAWPHSAANYLDHVAQATSFEQIAAVNWNGFNVGDPGQPPDRVRGLAVTANFFATLGVQPALGRAFTPDDDRPGHNNVLVISDAAWRQRFGGDPGVIGRDLRLNGEPATIIGVMPAKFDHPQLWGRVDAWRPIAFSDEARQNRGNNYLTEIARLKPGVTLEQAQAELATLAARLAAAYPTHNAQEGLRLMPLGRSGQDESGQQLTWFVMGLAAFVLLIACANLANLQFARHAARVREHAIRAALGASRARLMRGILTESLALSLAGGALGVLFAVWCNDALGSRLDLGGATALVVPLDWRVLAFAIAISVATGLGFGLLPAGLAARANVNDALKQGGRGATAGRSQHHVRHGLIVAEVALALVLLAGAGFFLRGLQRFMHLDPGWKVDGLVTGSVTLRGKKYADAPARRVFFEQMETKLAALPGIERVGFANALPTWGYSSSSNFVIEGRPQPAPGAAPLATVAPVSPDFFATVGIPLRRGRGFTADDTTDKPAVVIINETMARTLFPNEDPIGKRLGDATPFMDHPRQIVGVVGDIRSVGKISSDDTRFQMYYPVFAEPWNFQALALRTQTAPDTLAPALRRALAELDPDQPIYGITTVHHEISASLANFDLVAWMLAGFALLGVGLAALGIYGVIASAVVQRTNEIGIRLALGAQVRDILALILGQGLRLALLGTALGLAGAWGVARLLRSIAPEFPAADALTAAVVTTFLLAAATFACWLPARRATKVNPIIALRAE